MSEQKADSPGMPDITPCIFPGSEKLPDMVHVSVARALRAHAASLQERLDTCMQAHDDKGQYNGALTDALRRAESAESDRDRLREALQSILDEADGREDVVDGTDGPRPNEWMRVAQIARAALKGEK